MKRLADWLYAPFWFVVALLLAYAIVAHVQTWDTMDNRREIH